MTVSCGNCTSPAVLKRPKTGEALCKECFFRVFEDEVHKTIVSNHLFNSGDLVAVAASGGKDSTVLAHVMKLLNERHNYGVQLFLLSIDEGITGYRDDSLEVEIDDETVQHKVDLSLNSPINRMNSDYNVDFRDIDLFAVSFEAFMNQVMKKCFIM